MIVECEVLEGLADLAESELRQAFPGGVRHVERAPTWLRFDFGGRVGDLLTLRTAVAAWSVVEHPVPRPKALLGHQHLQALLRQVGTARALWPDGAFTGVRVSAAGRDSSVMRRLGEEVAAATGLSFDAEDGDLVVRVRPGGAGWHTLVRLSPRPLSARPWRVRNLPGALNATIAAGMVALSAPVRSDRVLNLMCGSATLLIERVLRGPAAVAVGVDIDGEVLGLAAENAAAAGVGKRVRLEEADATALPYADRSFDVLLADLPYGHRMGTHEDNEALYPAVLAEAARVAAPGARFVVVTHELRRFTSALEASPWRTEHERQVFQKGHHPKLWVLRPR